MQHKGRQKGGPTLRNAFIMTRLLLLIVLLAALGAAHARTPIFPLAALEPGQRGYGLTAGAGNRIERFSVEVLALQYDVGSGFPLVLVRAGGPPIEAAGGIASGMSGSPVYLKRKGRDALLGAIGYTFPNSTGGLGLVTPMESMRRADPHQTVAAFGAPFEPQAAVPVRTPLLLTGLSAQASALLGPLLADELLPLPLQTGGAQRPDDAAYTLTPGSAVSVQLVRGDITLAAIGTLTLAENGAFWAFGHPLLGRGKVSFALAPAYVTATVPSRTVPFKLADSGQRLLGSVTQDRPYALSGLLGQKPDFMPVTLSLSGDAGATTRRFEVTRDERFYAPLVAAATLQSLTELLRETGAGSAELAWKLTLADGQTLNLLEQISDPENIALAAAKLAGQPLAQLADNPFQGAELAKVELSLNYSAEQRVAEIVEVVPAKRRLERGDTLELNVRLQPYRQGPEVETIRFTLPRTVRGPLKVTVRGGLSAPDRRTEERAPPLYSFAEFLTALEHNVQASELVVEAVIGGETRLLKRLSLPYLIAGSEGLTLRIGETQVRTGPSEPKPERRQPAPPLERDPLDNTPPLEPGNTRSKSSLGVPEAGALGHTP